MVNFASKITHSIAQRMRGWWGSSRWGGHDVGARGRNPLFTYWYILFQVLHSSIIYFFFYFVMHFCFLIYWEQKLLLCQRPGKPYYFLILFYFFLRYGCCVKQPEICKESLVKFGVLRLSLVVLSLLLSLYFIHAIPCFSLASVILCCALNNCAYIDRQAAHRRTYCWDEIVKLVLKNIACEQDFVRESALLSVCSVCLQAKTAHLSVCSSANSSLSSPK